MQNENRLKKTPEGMQGQGSMLVSEIKLMWI